MERNELIKYWYSEYSDGIYKFLVYYTRKKDVEDLVQETFIRAIKGFETYTGMSKPKTWLYSIARHVAIDDMRKKRFLQWVSFEKAHNLSSIEKTPDELVHASEDIKELYYSINKLKGNYREVLILRGIKDFSVSETAQILGWNESKVRVTLHRAMVALQKVHTDLERRGIN